MEEADFGLTESAFASIRGGQTAKPGEHFVRFYIDTVKDDVESMKQGQPKYKDVEMIEIRAPGNNSNVIVTECNDYYKNFFRVPYQAWKQTQNPESSHQGIPLSAFPLVSRSQVEELKHYGIFTVEHLANVADANLQHGYRSLREKAQLFLEAAAEMAPAMRLQTEVSQLKNEMEALKKRNEALEERIRLMEVEE